MRAYIFGFLIFFAPISRALADDTTLGNTGWFLPDTFWRFVGVYYTLGPVAAGVVLGLVLWLLVSIISSVPVAVLKQRAAISAWIGTPGAVLYAVVWVSRSQYVPDAAFYLIVWTPGFAALIIGGWLRHRFSPKWVAPEPLTLPVATLVFAAVSAVLLKLYVEYGIFLPYIYCEPDFPFVSVCEIERWRGFVFAAAVLLGI